MQYTERQTPFNQSPAGMRFFNAALRTGPGDSDTFAEAFDLVLGVEGSAELPWPVADASEDFHLLAALVRDCGRQE